MPIIVIRAHFWIGLLIRVVAHCSVNGLNISRQWSSGYQGGRVVRQFTSQNYNQSRKIQNGAQIRTYFTSPIGMLPRFYFYSYFWWFCENFCTYFFFLIFSLYLFQNLVDRKLMNNREAEPVVIGGMVLDINAIPSESAKPRTTTPGKVCWLTFLIL